MPVPIAAKGLVFAAFLPFVPTALLFRFIVPKMPNQAAVASVGIIAASVAVAAAIAVYESPELRRMAEDFRRRIAIALHSLGDNLDPDRRDEPLFNRPEDAEGFLQSRGVVGAEGVDADEESRRRQREELMYWNALREQKLEKNRGDEEKPATRRGSSFDDFMKQDQNAEKGTYVFNTGAQVKPEDDGLRRRGGLEGVRGLNASVYANPFADENGIDCDDHPGMEDEEHPLTPGKDEVMSDLYDVSPRPIPSLPVLSLQSIQAVPEVLFDFNESQPQQAPISAEATLESSRSSVTLDQELQEEEYVTAGQSDREDVYASIQAWAQNSNQSFYSPLPMSPAAPLSEPEIISDGAPTPTGSAAPSVIGSDGVLVNDTVSSKVGDFDVMSDDDDGIATPSSWSEVGSVISESDGPVHA